MYLGIKEDLSSVQVAARSNINPEDKFSGQNHPRVHSRPPICKFYEKMTTWLRIALTLDVKRQKFQLSPNQWLQLIVMRRGRDKAMSLMCLGQKKRSQFIQTLKSTEWKLSGRTDCHLKENFSRYKVVRESIYNSWTIPVNWVEVYLESDQLKGSVTVSESGIPTNPTPDTTPPSKWHDWEFSSD